MLADRSAETVVVVCACGHRAVGLPEHRGALVDAHAAGCAQARLPVAGPPRCCSVCGAELPAAGPHRTTCSPACRATARRLAWQADKLATLGERVCVGCGDPLPATARADLAWCSRACRDRARVRPVDGPGPRR